MPENPERTDRQVWGAALRALRLRCGKSQDDAAGAFEPEGYVPGDPDKGVSTQRWQQIEKGQYKFTEPQRRRLVKSIGATLEELNVERARILGHRPSPSLRGVAEGETRGLVIPIWGRTELGRDGWKVKDADVSESGFDLRELLGPSIGATHVADDTMQPKAPAGALVIFDRSRRPRPEQGCVVETEAGELYPRLFLGMDDDHVMVRSLKAGQPVAFPRAQVKGVYAVRFWGD